MGRVFQGVDVDPMEDVFWAEHLTDSSNRVVVCANTTVHMGADVLCGTVRRVEFVIIFIVAVGSAFFSQYVASARGFTSTVFFWVGFFVPVVGILVAFLTPIPGQHETATTESPPTTSQTTGLVADLGSLASLHTVGELSDEEYAEAKRQLLQGHAG
jgi:Na+-translocating ferredoxin:NAD+ oxidoreductase RnfE subunit